MTYSDIALISENVPAPVSFYRQLLLIDGEGDDSHTYFNANGTGIAIYAKDAAEKDMGFDFSKHWGNSCTVIGFNQ